ncbi:hypothetical protein PINS_up009019 [Pythium insidiosum]|nr:hypothetical protein PINS_up009019 [Pythium insidiosum]
MPAGASNIPVVNGVRQVPASMAYYAAPSSTTNAYSMPHGVTATVVSAAPLPSAVPFFEYMDKCRYIAGFMLCYYLCSFFFLQPFFLGSMGILTGFLGYYGSRPPIFEAHVKWIRAYVWVNYVMIGMNIWYVLIAIFFLSDVKKHLARRDGTSNDALRDDSFRLVGQDHAGFVLAVVVSLNLLLHVRGLRTGRRFHLELLCAGPQPILQRAVVVLNRSRSHIV